MGLRINAHDLEYAFWWLLQAARNRIQVEVIEPPASLQRYLDTEAAPWAIICTNCSGD